MDLKPIAQKLTYPKQISMQPMYSGPTNKILNLLLLPYENKKAIFSILCWISLVHHWNHVDNHKLDNGEDNQGRGG